MEDVDIGAWLGNVDAGLIDEYKGDDDDDDEGERCHV